MCEWNNQINEFWLCLIKARFHSVIIHRKQFWTWARFIFCLMLLPGLQFLMRSCAAEFKKKKKKMWKWIYASSDRCVFRMNEGRDLMMDRRMDERMNRFTKFSHVSPQVSQSMNGRLGLVSQLFPIILHLLMSFILV